MYAGSGANPSTRAGADRKAKPSADQDPDLSVENPNPSADAHLPRPVQRLGAKPRGILRVRRPVRGTVRVFANHADQGSNGDDTVHLLQSRC